MHGVERIENRQAGAHPNHQDVIGQGEALVLLLAAAVAVAVGVVAVVAVGVREAGSDLLCRWVYACHHSLKVTALWEHRCEV